MLQITKAQYERFGQDFLTFYLENGFADKSKKQIDLKMLSLIYQFFPNASETELADQLRIEQGTLRRMLRAVYARYPQSLFSDTQRKQRLLNALLKTKYKITSGNIHFILPSILTKIDFLRFCAEQNIIVDYSFNRDIIKISCDDLCVLITHIAKVDENITIQEGEDLLNQLTTENLKECLSGILNDLSKKYAGMDFKTINGTLKALFKKLKPN